METIGEWRKKIDELDRKLVELVNERARCAQEIGRLKRNTQMPIYEPDRERLIFENVHKVNQGPLPDRELTRIYERVIDVMRKLQEDEMKALKNEPGPSGTEFEAEVND
ncbi:MAG: chorismate mutase [Terriglobales bacterium]